MEGWGKGLEKWDHLEGQYSNLGKQQERSEQGYLKNGFSMASILRARIDSTFNWLPRGNTRSKSQREISIFSLSNEHDTVVTGRYWDNGEINLKVMQCVQF